MKSLSPLFAIGLVIAAVVFNACKDDPAPVQLDTQVEIVFGGKIDLDHLANYANQGKPAYIIQDNTNTNPITDAGATLGRVLFYDANLSVDNNISCAHCHKQEFAFSDTAAASTGVNGSTGRHSMRLINSRFGLEQRFFWDERAINLEAQTTQPVRDHKEMGFSGANGDPSFADLAAKLQAIGYYKELFTFVYGDEEVTEERIQKALSQFVRSIQSFDSKYDVGRASAPNNVAPFPNFTPQENQGKQLFNAPPIFDPNGVRTGGGLGCQGCHHAPEFDIDPASRNNGVTGVIGSASRDFLVTRSPSLRNMLKADGSLVTAAMHDASLTTLDAVLEHYNNIPNEPANTNLDPKLRPAGQLQKLQMTVQEKEAMVAFLKTLSGTAVYTDPRWGNPFH
jgi:cytochrome c peroxidase